MHRNQNKNIVCQQLYLLNLNNDLMLFFIELVYCSVEFFYGLYDHIIANFML